MDDEEFQKGQCSLGIGDGSCVNTSEEVPPTENDVESVQSGSATRKKGSTLSSSIKKMVRGRSRTAKHEKKEEITEEPVDPETQEKEEIVGDSSKRSLYKLFQNVSSGINKRRSSLSSTDIRDDADQIERGRSGFSIFRRSASRSELDGPENNIPEGQRGGTLGRIFGRRTTSKTELEVDERCQEANKGGTLGRLFRRSSSKGEERSMTPETKSASLSRRIGSSLMGAFGKKEIEKAQEAPQ